MNCMPDLFVSRLQVQIELHIRLADIEKPYHDETWESF